MSTSKGDAAVGNDRTEAVEVENANHQRIENGLDTYESRPINFWTVMACVVRYAGREDSMWLHSYSSFTDLYGS